METRPPAIAARITHVPSAARRRGRGTLHRDRSPTRERQLVAVGSSTDHDAFMAKARDMLQLRLHHAATPARVARAAAMFEEALRAVGAANDTDTTLVVENRELVATLRTRSRSGTDAVHVIIQTVRNPLAAPAQPGRSELAGVLARYAREEGRYRPELRLPRHEEPLCILDETFAFMMDALAAVPEVGSHRGRGTTYVYSKILRVGRTDERHAYRVRIIVDGRPLEVPIGELAVGPFFDAAKRDAVVRLRLQAEWTQSPGQPPVQSKADVIGMDDVTLGAGARILALAREYNVITADELPEVLASIEEMRRGE